MGIKINWRALARIKWHEFLMRFVLGGAITVITGLIAKHFGPVVGGLFLAFPAIFPSGVTLIEKHEKEKKRRAGVPKTIRGRLAAALDARGAAMGTLALAAFGALIWRLLPLFNAAIVFAGALAAWLALAILVWRVRKLAR